MSLSTSFFTHLKILRRLSAWPLTLLRFWDAAKGFNNGIDNAITHLFIDLGYREDLSFECFRHAETLNNLEIFTWLTHCMEPEWYSSEIDAAILALLRGNTVSSLLKEEIRQAFLDYCQERKKSQTQDTGLVGVVKNPEQYANTIEHDQLEGLRFYLKRQKLDFFQVVDGRFTKLFHVTFQIYSWREALAAKTIFGPQRLRLVPIHELFHRCNIEGESIDELRNRFHEQVHKIHVEKKPLRDRCHLREHVRVGRIYRRWIRIPRRKNYPPGPPTLREPFRCKLVQKADGTEWLQHISIRSIPALVKWDEKLQDAAILAQGVFGHFYEGQCCGGCAQRNEFESRRDDVAVKLINRLGKQPKRLARAFEGLVADLSPTTTRKPSKTELSFYLIGPIFTISRVANQSSNSST
jgi:hypothetical protein